MFNKKTTFSHENIQLICFSMYVILYIYQPERLLGDWLPFLLRGVRDRLFLSIVGLLEIEWLGD